MNKILIVIVFALTITSCATTKTSSTSSASGDGSSYAAAVIAKSISSEYEWIREHYPGSQVQMQSLRSNAKKYYDVLTITLADGSTKDVYFDINSFYGKGF